MIDDGSSLTVSVTLEVTNEAAHVRDRSVSGSHRQVSARGLLSCLREHLDQFRQLA